MQKPHTNPIILYIIADSLKDSKGKDVKKIGVISWKILDKCNNPPHLVSHNANQDFKYPNGHSFWQNVGTGH